MADIVDPTVAAFVNERIRPLCDALIGLNIGVDSMALQWFNVVSPLLSGAADSDVIIDGSESDGRNSLTKSDVVLAITQLLEIQTQLDGVGVEGIVAKPSVNPRTP